MAQCADCDVAGSSGLMFRIKPPRGRDEGGGKPFYLCVGCWDRIMGAAVLAMLR